MSKQSRKMTLNRDYTLDTLYGHSIRFTKGEAVHVPPLAQAGAIAIGATFVDGKDAVEADAAVDPDPVHPDERAERTLAAVKMLIERNKVADFTAAGAPKVSAVSKEADFTVTSQEIQDAMQTYHDEKEAARS
jgi:hypothetical protein